VSDEQDGGAKCPDIVSQQVQNLGRGHVESLLVVGMIRSVPQASAWAMANRQPRPEFDEGKQRQIRSTSYNLNPVGTTLLPPARLAG